ncbi:MAG TPA: outer membrane beta-barrel domain-containing protein [Myxococcales bacterium]|nr:outer membrane beta-barrel domain-containing protein [Myxococcales bacterium]HIN86974.1 outer membrane beta-barrel domain-containing protein [Myxococcales bacterium]
MTLNKADTRTDSDFEFMSKGDTLDAMNTTHPMLTRFACLLIVGMLIIPGMVLADSDPPTMEDQFDLYWAKRRAVKNIHKRLFRKDGRHEFALTAGVIPNDEFFKYFPVGVKYDYYFSEDFAIEVAGTYMPNQKTDLQNFIETGITEGLEVLLPQYLVWQAGLGVLWTPLHGKVAIFDTKLGHFDFGIAMGVMVLGSDVTKGGANKSDGSQEIIPRMDVGGNLGATVRFYLSDFIALRVDYRHFFFNGRNTDDEAAGLSFPAEISLGLSFFTSAPK